MGKGLEDIWGGAKKKTAELNEAAQRAHEAAAAAQAAAQAEVRAEILAMQQQILTGEGSTGNPLHDGIIVLYGEKVHPKIVEKYERVASALSHAGTGEPVFAIRRYIKSSGYTGFGGRASNSLHKNMAMGILSGNQILFDYDKKTASLPTSVHVYDSWSHARSTEVSEGVIKIDAAENDFSLQMYGFQIKSLDEPIVPLSGERIELPGFELQPVLDTEILVGREGIRDWLVVPDDNLARDTYFGAMRDLSKRLNILPIEPATEWQSAKISQGRY